MTPVMKAPGGSADAGSTTSPSRASIAALVAILTVAMLLRAWGLDRNGWGTEYYSAAVRSMLASWHTFFYDAFDPAGFITIDKPPLAFWIQAASAWVFGHSPSSLLLPQVVEGVISVGLVFVFVQRRFGDAAALLAALFLALMPITVAVDRSNNTEPCLSLLLLLSAWTFVVANERASLRHLILSAFLLGLAFNTKFLAALVLVPIYIALYLNFAPCSISTRGKHLVAAAAVLAIVSLSWITAFDLTKPGDRPYAAKTRGNTMWELAFSTYGAKILPGADVASADVAVVPTPRANGGRRSAFYDDVPVGPLRLADPHLAAQFSWLLPIALAGAARATHAQTQIARDREAADLPVALAWLDPRLRNSL